MLRYSVTRLFRALLTFWGVLTIVFIVPRLLGDPVVLMVPPGTDRETMEIMRHSLGLDRPIIVQYFEYLAGVFRLDFGESILFRADAMKVVLRRFPVTLQLAVAAVMWGIFIGIPLGLLSARRPGSALDHASRSGAVLGQSVPGFISAIVLLYLFTVQWRVLPPRGPDEGLASLPELILPSLALGFGIIGPIARLTRSSMLEVVNTEYITMARLKGLRERVIIGKHAFRNAIIPVMTYLSLTFAALLGGVVIVESIFGWPGIGRVAISAINEWDFSVIQAVTVVGSTAFIIVNYMVDLIYAVADPRIRHT